MAEAEEIKTRVLLVDDHRVVLEGIRSALRSQAEFEVIGEALDGAEALKKVKLLKPDIVVLDISMPNLNGIDATFKIRQINPRIRIVIFTMYSNKEYVLDLFRAGISAYVLKEDRISDLILAMRAVREGGTYFSTKAPEILSDHMRTLEESQSEKVGMEDLSAREFEIFRLLAEGHSIREIAKRLSISPKTVESHKYNIMEKLHCRTRTDLTKVAIKRNLIQP